MCVCAPTCICSRPLPDAHARVGAEMRVTDACTYTCARGKNVLSPNIELYTYLRECAHVCLSWKCAPDMPFCSHICEHKSSLRANTSVCPRLHYVVPNITTCYNIVICIATDYYILLHITMYYNIWSFDVFTFSHLGLQWQSDTAEENSNRCKTQYVHVVPLLDTGRKSPKYLLNSGCLGSGTWSLGLRVYGTLRKTAAQTLNPQP